MSSNILVIILCFAFGVLLRQTGKVNEACPKTLGTIIIYISLPATVVLLTQQLEFSSVLLIPIAMPWLQLVGAMLLFPFLGKRLGWDHRTVGCLILTCGLGNTSFLGLPMVEAFWGKEALPYAIVTDQLGSFLALATLGLLTASYCSGKSSRLSDMIGRVVFFPPFIALIVGLLLRCVVLPEGLVIALQKIGSTLSPLALLTVGSQLDPKSALLRNSAERIGVAYKLLIGPALVFGIFFVLQLPRTLAFQTTIFEAAMPPMVSAGIVALEYELNPNLAATLIGVGMMLSAITLPLWWAVL